MKIKSILIIFLLLVVSQLKGQDTKPPEVLDLTRLQKIKEIKNTTDIFELVEFIPLETKTECITEIQHTVVTQSEIFMFSKAQGCILKFDREGNFLGKIGRKGRGPGEFGCPIPGIQYFNNNIYIFDWTSKKIIKYSTDGKRFHEIFLDEKPGFLSSDVLDENCFLLANLYPFSNKSGPFYELLSYNAKGNLIYKFPLNSNIANPKNSMYPFLFWHFNNNVYYKSTYCDTAFKILSPTKSVAAYILSPGKYRYESKGLLSSEVSPKDIVIHNIQETPRYLIINYFNNGVKRAVYDKITGTLFGINALKEPDENSINECVFLWPFSFSRFESKVPGEYVTFIEPSVLTGLDINNLKIKSGFIKSELIKLQRKVNENDNPVVVIMKEKEND
jgi:hypothetical protein